MPEQEETRQEVAPAPKKKGFLGCSFPLFIALLIIALVLFLVGFLSGPIGQSMVGLDLPEWLRIAKPHPELPAEVVFHFLGFPIANSIIATWLTMITLVGFAFLVTRRLREVPARWQALLEAAIGALLNFCKSVAGEHNGRLFFPIVATIFLFVIFNGWLGLLPVFGSVLIHTHEGAVHLLRAANTDINTPLAVAIVSFISVWYFGLKALGLGFLKQFFNFGQFLTGLGQMIRGKVGAGLKGIFLGIINIFIGMVEFLSQLVRIISFTLRLFGNMTAGEILLLMATFLLPFLFADIFYGLEILVGFVQALIFSGLTLIFLTVAVTSHEQGEEGHHK